MKIKPLLAFVLCLSVSVAHSETAKLSGTSLSLQINDATSNIQGTSAQVIFTTYDGNALSFPYSYKDGILTYSRELKKVGSNYCTDYYAISAGKIIDYGEISFHFPVTFPPFSIDFDMNGIDDICENKSFNASLKGSFYSNYYGSYGTLTGSATRNVNTPQGTLNLAFHNVYKDWTVVANFYIGTLSGTVDYSSQKKTITFNYSTTWDNTSNYPSVTSSYEIIDKNQIGVMEKDFFPTTVFKRTGNKYTAMVQLIDGGFKTFWPDYQTWALEIEDLNDSDHDGIPNLSDQRNSPNIMPILLLLLD